MTSESDIESAAVRWCEDVVGGMAWKLSVPSVRGVPDRLFLFPDGISLFVEFKNESGRESPHQIHMRMELNVRHHRCIVARSLEDVMKEYVRLRAQSLDVR